MFDPTEQLEQQRYAATTRGGNVLALTEHEAS
jgi:hypothetical protein